MSIAAASVVEADTITEAGLVWRIKASFVDYIEAMPDGRVHVSDGARSTDDGFFFPSAGTDNAGTESFSGTVSFNGHHGLLCINITDPTVLAATGSRPRTIEIADTISPGGRLQLARLVSVPEAAPSAATRTYQPRLTDAGSDLFFERYPAGTVLDNLVIHRR
ncbi:MAG: HtaA domain-containing protein [Galactobacter sp.]|uniref:HtaA domain-containing protein n=1 Tax=Galactobacter sp. TaxID=2676125 RepID=UPI0025C461B8|nr:HtaA domain-containing protein [Galactobacter sp.]